MIPISSTQVNVDGLIKPDSALFCGTTLNDWLKYIVEKQGEIDWKTVDTSCLEAYSQVCDKNLKTIIELLIERVCTLQSLIPGCDCCGGSGTTTGDCCNEDVYTLELGVRWVNVDSTNPAKAYVSNGRVELSGRITGGSTLLTFANLPSQATPSFEKRLPFAFGFSLPNINNEHPFIRVSTSGDLDLVWSGSTPASSLSGYISLDGISYRL